MRYLGVFASLIMFSFPVFSADMTKDERCEKLGEVTAQASVMRIAGKDTETATSALLEIYDQPGSGLSTKQIRAYTNWAYMMRMEPEKARKYAVDQCKQS
ncbi:hypothetical protein FE845_14510 [Marinobacter sp. 1-4A]|uniref:hypothetical protein n=1 Tax=unclassified Marinobacter TaxID=83889 RepID=UPI001904019E|nr:hypothetical protein [Marinobacter sp. 1-4A]MBK1852558.1 hypothetical protein [Marinobacter sp. 1-4A]